MKKAKALMVQGTASHVGKSLVITALCKLLADQGFHVAPFKAQNMSLNSYVTEDGAEIARAQALQAFAAGIEPTADMNPLLLKPKGDGSCQIILHGRPHRDIGVSDYYSKFVLRFGLRAVEESLNRLLAQYDIVLIEGAGSPAEINLYEVDVANMRVAELGNAPVLLVADIDRGGVFASIVGTLKLLRQGHRRRVKGVIINKFRGDWRILEPGLKKLEEITGKPVLGVLPFIDHLILPNEDSVSLDEAQSNHGGIKIAVLRLPRISNFSDFDPFNTPSSSVIFARSPKEWGKPDAIIIPGTKNTVSDLHWLRRQGFDTAIEDELRDGVPVIGVCGGYQMLGREVIDVKGIEGGFKGRHPGLGLLDADTSFESYSKVTVRVRGKVVAGGPLLFPALGQMVEGYEIHMGKTRVRENRPLLQILWVGGFPTTRFDGAVAQNGLVFGSYLHGLFDSPPLRNALLQYLAKRKRFPSPPLSNTSIEERWRSSIEELAKIFRENVDMAYVTELLKLPPLL